MHRFNKIICAMMKNGYTKVRNGCAMIKNGYTKVKNGCAKVKNSCAKVKNGYAKVKNGCTKLRNGCAKVKNGCAKVKNGCTKEKNGCTKEKNGYFSLFLPNYIIIKVISGALVDVPHLPSVAHLAPIPCSHIPFSSPLGKFAYSS